MSTPTTVPKIAAVGTNNAVSERPRSSYRRACDSPTAMYVRPNAVTTLMSPLYKAASGTRNGSSWLAGVTLSKNPWSGSVRISNPWTRAYRIVPKSRVRARLGTSRWRMSNAAGNRITATDGMTCKA